jgi:hypothetical protein
LGKTLGTAVNHYNDLTGEFKKIDKDIVKLSPANKRITFDPENLNRPQLPQDDN